MQIVSTEWTDNQKRPFVGESFVEVSYEVSDPSAQSDASATSNGEAFYSDAADTVKKTTKAPGKFATLEHNIWALDSTFDILPSSPPYGNNGYIGNELSGADGVFQSPPTITISFGAIHAALVPGVTIRWATAYDEWADTIRVRAYLNDSVQSEKTVSGNKVMQTVVSMDIENYNKITIEILKWTKPYRRARIESILVGIERVYTKAELMEFSHSMTVNPLSASLPKAEVTFKVNNVDGEYNPDNPVGAEKYLIERQEVRVRYGYKLPSGIEWIPAGVFYTSEWDTPQNGITATFKARDILEFMTDDYAGAVTGSLYDIAERALLQANVPVNPDGTVRWNLDDSLRTITVPEGAELKETKISEVLQLVANAGCCVIYQDRGGALHIKPMQTDLSDYTIDQDNSYSKAEIALTKQLKSVDVNNKEYVLEVSPSGDTQPIKNPLISVERAPIVALWVSNILKNRKILSGGWRADPRVDVLDRVTVQNQFAESTVVVTELEFSYAGAFRGKYEGRVI